MEFGALGEFIVAHLMPGVSCKVKIYKLGEGLNIKEKFASAIESNRVFYKPALILGMISGSIYLNGFLSEYGVPFPLDIGVLTSALLVIGTLSLLLVTITTCYVLLVSLVNLDPFDTCYQRVINTSKSGIYAPKLTNYLILYFFIYLLPFCLFFIFLMSDAFESVEFKIYILLFLYLIWSFLYSAFISRNAYDTIKEKALFSLKMMLHIFLSQIVSIVSLCFFVLILVPRVGNLDDLTFFGVLCVYLIVNIFCLIPVFSSSKFNEIINDENKTVSSDVLIRNTQVTPVWVVVVTLVVISCLPPFSPYVGELPLRILNIGGGVEFIAVDGKRQCNSWPDFIVSHKDESTCTTKKGKLLIQLGDRAYAIFKDVNSEKIVSLNLSKSSIVSDIPEDSIYLKPKSKNDSEIKK